jgi:hypothetical protein
MGLITSGGAVGNIHGAFTGDITNATVATTLRGSLTTINTVNTTVNSFMTTTGGTAAGSQSFFIEAIFNCTTSGSIIVQWGTEVAASLAQLRTGSSLIVEVLN